MCGDRNYMESLCTLCSVCHELKTGLRIKCVHVCVCGCVHMAFFFFCIR